MSHDRRPETSASPDLPESPDPGEASGRKEGLPVSHDRRPEPSGRSVLARLLNEEDPAPSGDAREPELREAVVESWAGGRGALRGGTPAVLAPSCLLVPRCGDTVVAWTRQGAPACVTAILVRADPEAPAELNLGARATIDASRLDLRAEHVTVAAREILTNAAAHHAVTGTKTEHVATRVADVGRDVRRAGHVSDEVTGDAPAARGHVAQQRGARGAPAREGDALRLSAGGPVPPRFASFTPFPAAVSALSILVFPHLSFAFTNG